MPRADADNPWEDIFPSMLRSCWTATAPVRSKITSRRQCPQTGIGDALKYSASRRGENRPGKAAGCVCRRVDPWRAGVAAQGCSRYGARG